MAGGCKDVQRKSRLTPLRGLCRGALVYDSSTRSAGHASTTFGKQVRRRTSAFPHIRWSINQNRIDELHDDDSLTDAVSAEHRRFFSLRQRRENVDDLDAGLEDGGRGASTLQRWHRTVNRARGPSQWAAHGIERRPDRSCYHLRGQRSFAFGEPMAMRKAVSSAPCGFLTASTNPRSTRGSTRAS